MPRKDRTFSSKDVIRIYCNNLDRSEQIDVLRTMVSGSACGEPVFDCEALEDFLLTLDYICTLISIAGVVAGVLKRIPWLIPLSIALDRVCNALNLVNGLYENLCPARDRIPRGVLGERQPPPGGQVAEPGVGGVNAPTRLPFWKRAYDRLRGVFRRR